MTMEEGCECMYSKIMGCGLLGIDGFMVEVETDFPIRRITMNLAPANLKKEGSSFDLSIALGILASTGVINQAILRQALFIGELSLDGKVKSVIGALPIAICARQNDI